MNTMHIHVDNEVMNIILNIDGLVQEKRDSIANALELQSSATITRATITRMPV